MENEQNLILTEESKNQDKQDHFSDIEDPKNPFQMKEDFIKN